MKNLIKNKKIPTLRFPEYSREWEEKRLGEVARFFDEKRIPLKQQDRQKRLGVYSYYGASGIIDCIDDYIFDGEYVLLGEDGANIVDRSKRLAFLVKGKFWVNNHAHVLEAEDSNYFLAEYLELLRYDKYNTGTAQPKLNATICKKIKINIPKKQEQQKIANFLGSVDEWLENLREQKKSLEEYKKGMMQKIFPAQGQRVPEIRFRDENGSPDAKGYGETKKEFGEWEEKKLEEVLKTISTKKYQIKNSEILKKGEFKVVDQGKKKVVGFNNGKDKVLKNKEIIVYGDHTTIVKYIDFDFIVGADGTKLLKSDRENLKFIYYNLCHNNVKSEGYKRHFSILKKLKLQIPSIQEQQKIAEFLTSLDNLIESKQKQISQAEEWKKGLMQGLFV